MAELLGQPLRHAAQLVCGDRRGLFVGREVGEEVRRHVVDLLTRQHLELAHAAWLARCERQLVDLRGQPRVVLGIVDMVPPEIAALSPRVGDSIGYRCRHYVVRILAYAIKRISRGWRDGQSLLIRIDFEGEDQCLFKPPPGQLR